jgi:hypothetical protein
MKKRRSFKIVFEKLKEVKKEQDLRLQQDIEITQEVNETINLLRQYIDSPDQSQITITRS